MCTAAESWQDKWLRPTDAYKPPMTLINDAQQVGMATQPPVDVAVRGVHKIFSYNYCELFDNTLTLQS